MTELAREYFTELDMENTVTGGIMLGPKGVDGPVTYRANPVEETAIECAISSGKIQVMETLLTWEPENLEKMELDDE